MLLEKNRDNFAMLNWLDDYMIGHKGFIAGGCFKNIFNNEKIKDLDIFFENETDYQDAVNYFDSMTSGYDFDDKRDEEYTFAYENSKVKAYKNINTGIRIELCRAVFGSAKEVISQFDFTVAKFAYYKVEVEDNSGAEIENDTNKKSNQGTHIEYRIVCDENFFEHLHLKRLITDNQILYPMSTFERMIRYIGYGYKPCKETKIKIAKAIRNLSDDMINTSESLYAGMD